VSIESKTARFRDALSRGLHAVGVFGGIPVLVIVLSIDVLLRYVFNSPLAWGSEVSSLILLVVFFACLPQVTRSRGHIRMDMLYRLMPPAARAVSDVLSGLAGFVFSILLAVESFRSGLNMLRWGERAEMIALPYWPFAFFAGLCGIILTVQFSLQTLGAFSSTPPEDRS